MMSKKHLLVLEIVWITTGILSLLAGIRYLILEGGNRIIVFIILALVSFLFAWIRHKERKKS